MKHIISCSDGTWNKPTEDIRSTNNEDAADSDYDFDTNVARMYKSICSSKGNIQQVKIYDQGVGTGIGWTDKVLGGATREGIDKNIKDVTSSSCSITSRATNCFCLALAAVRTRRAVLLVLFATVAF